MELNIEPKKYTRLRIKMHNELSESLVKYVFSESGYKIYKSTGLSGLLKTRRNDWLRDEQQKERIKRCLKICDYAKKKGLPEYIMGIPDFFVFSDSEEFFVEVKVNKSPLKQSQKDVFPLLNEIIPIKIARINLNFDIKSNNMMIYNLSENKKLQFKSIDGIKKINPELNENELNGILKILKNEAKKTPHYNDIEDKDDIIICSYEEDDPIEFDEEYMEE